MTKNQRKYDKEIFEINNKIIRDTIMLTKIFDEEMKFKSKFGLFAS
ncbi:MAG: hypothetical protein ACK4YO_03530 [Candidatus Altarchaeaceae archaeon]